MAHKGDPLQIHQCIRCGLWVSPPAADCPDCAGALESRPVSGTGTVFTFTVNHQPFNPDVPLPYVIAIVTLDEQPDLRIAANIVDCEPDSVHVGMSVVARPGGRDDEASAPVFVPRVTA